MADDESGRTAGAGARGGEGDVAASADRAPARGDAGAEGPDAVASDAPAGDRPDVGTPPAPDANPAGVGPPCAGGELFCDTFEDQSAGKVPGAPWRGASGSVLVDTKHAFSGKASARLSGAGGITPTPSAWPRERLYGRMMLYFESLPIGAPPAHSFLATATNSGDAQLCCSPMRFGMVNSGAGSWDETSLAGCDQIRIAKSTVPRNRWVCYEFMLDSTNNGWGVWIDGTPLPELTRTTVGGGCWSVPRVQSLRIGYESVHPTSGALALWIDDVALSDRKIGCPAGAGH